MESVDQQVGLRRMAAVWKRVLKREQIGPDDSFFTLGGHSVMAGTLVRAAGERFGVQIPLRALFEHSQLGEFTEHVLALAAPSAPQPDAVVTDVPLAMTAFQRRICWPNRSIRTYAITYPWPSR